MTSAAGPQTLGALAVRFGCALRGEPDQPIDMVATLAGGPRALGFVAGPGYREALRGTTLGAVVLAPRFLDDCPVAALLHANPHAVFARIAACLHPPPPREPGVHDSAVVEPGAQIDASAEVGPFAFVSAGARIGARCRIGAHGFVGRDACIGDDTWLHTRATVCAGTVIGARCQVHPGAVVGSDGFGNAREGEAWVKVPQLGIVRIGDDVEIGANTTIDRGALGDTEIHDGVRLDNQIQIAHNVVVGEHTAIAACTGIAGSTRIGRRCMIGGGTGIGGQISIGDDIVIAGFGMVTKSITAPGMYSSVFPVEEVRLWRRLVGRFKRLDALAARVVRLEKTAGYAAEGQHDDDE